MKDSTRSSGEKSRKIFAQGETKVEKSVEEICGEAVKLASPDYYGGVIGQSERISKTEYLAACKAFYAEGKRQGLSGEKLELFTKYVTIRFPRNYSEKHDFVSAYVGVEWVDRFVSGREYGVSDGKGRALLRKLSPKYEEEEKKALKEGWSFKSKAGSE